MSASVDYRHGAKASKGAIEISAKVRFFRISALPLRNLRMSLLDENTAILMKFEAEGKDLSSMKLIDFSHLFADVASANRFAADAEAEGFKIAVDQSHSSEHTWDVTASKVLLPSADAITEAEAQLSTLAEFHQGYADGWGLFNSW